MQEWWSEIISTALGFLGGATIGSLISIRVMKSSTNNARTVTQSNINAGRDNIGGDRTNTR